MPSLFAAWRTKHLFDHRCVLELDAALFILASFPDLEIFVFVFVSLSLSFGYRCDVTVFGASEGVVGYHVGGVDAGVTVADHTDLNSAG